MKEWSKQLLLVQGSHTDSHFKGQVIIKVGNNPNSGSSLSTIIVWG